MIYHLRLRLVSPVLLGGSQTGKFDASLTLRPPSIRGMLRFWTRALSKGNPRELESVLWGSAEVQRGQRVALIGAERLWATKRADPTHRKLFPPKETTLPMVDPSAAPQGTQPELVLRFRVPPSVEPIRCQVQAAVWTWLHLGGLGRRSRRGYGSLLWVPTKGPGDLLEGFVPGGFDWNRDLESPGTLTAYLRKGLEAVEHAIGAPSSSEPRQLSKWFELRTVAQVFVGKVLAKSYDGEPVGMEDTLHGLGGPRSTNAAEVQQLGNLPGPGQARQASPMLWRVFPVLGDSGKGFIPVMTWSPLDDTGVENLTPRSPMYAYLHGELGFCESLLSGQRLAGSACTLPHR